MKKKKKIKEWNEQDSLIDEMIERQIDEAIEKKVLGVAY